MPPLVMRLVFNKVVEKSPMLIKPISKNIQKQVETSLIENSINNILIMMEQQLQDNHWFAGEAFSGADIQMYFVAVAAQSRAELDNGKYVNLLNWLKRCKERAAFKRTEAKGGRIQF